MGDKPKAYSYIRFSTPAQMQGDSLRRQLDLSRKYASDHGLELIEHSYMQDTGKSAFDESNLERGGLGIFLEQAKKGEIEKGSYLLVESLDRITRAQVRKANKLFNEIIDCGITIVTLMDGMVFSPERMDGDDGGITVILSILTMMRAHEESVRKSQRVREAWQNKQQRAGFEKLTRTCPQWMRLSADRTKFELIPEAVNVVRRIVDMQISGLGQATIAKIFNQDGVPTLTYRHKRPGSVGWHDSVIQKIATSSALYGEYQAYTGQGRKRVRYGDPIQDYYPALITKEEFILLQQARQERLTRSRGVKGEAFANLFSGLLYCGYCGSKIRIISHKTKNMEISKRSIVCAHAKRGMGCHFLMWSYQNFEAMILTYLEGVDFVGLLDDKKSINKKIVTVSAMLEKLKGELKDNELRLDRLYDAVESGASLASLHERIEKQEIHRADISTAIKEKESELLAAKSLISDPEKVKISVLELCKRMKETEGNELYQLRAELASQIRRVVDRIDVFPGGFFYSEEEYQEIIDPYLLDWELDDSYACLKIPDKAQRFAQIVARNGRRYSTENAIGAKVKDMKDKFDILTALGYGVEFDRKMLKKSADALAAKLGQNQPLKPKKNKGL